MLLRMSPELAHFGSAVTSDLSPECAPKRTSVDRSEFMGSRPKSGSHSRAISAMTSGFVI
jgi:hypothetical protein